MESRAVLPTTRELPNKFWSHSIQFPWYALTLSLLSLDELHKLCYNTYAFKGYSKWLRQQLSRKGAAINPDIAKLKNQTRILTREVDRFRSDLKIFQETLEALDQAFDKTQTKDRTALVQYIRREMQNEIEALDAEYADLQKLEWILKRAYLDHSSGNHHDFLRSLLDVCQTRMTQIESQVRSWDLSE